MIVLDDNGQVMLLECESDGSEVAVRGEAEPLLRQHADSDTDAQSDIAA